MRELVCGLYIVFYTLITAPTRHKYKNATDPQIIAEGRAANYKKTQKLCRGILRLMGAKLQVKGQENLLNNGPSVYMGTHKSYLDIVVMITLIDEPLIFIGKEEVNDLPFIRTWFKAIGGLPMKREDIKQSFKVILEAIDYLKAGHSVAIFPEGTRSKGREMGEFKAGSFKLATKSNRPIVPIAMQDTFKLLEEKRRVKPATVYANIGNVIDVPNMTKEQKQSLVQDTEAYIRDLLEEVTM